MNRALAREDWIAYFVGWTRRNASRPTRLELFDAAGGQIAARGLPLVGAVVERLPGGDTSVEIILGGMPGAPERHLTHTVAGPQLIAVRVGDDGRDEALEIDDAAGGHLRLTFREPARLSA